MAQLALPRVAQGLAMVSYSTVDALVPGPLAMPTPTPPPPSFLSGPLEYAVFEKSENLPPCGNSLVTPALQETAALPRRAALRVCESVSHVNSPGLVLLTLKWVWVKIKPGHRTAGFSPWFHLPGLAPFWGHPICDPPPNG